MRYALLFTMALGCALAVNFSGMAARQSPAQPDKTRIPWTGSKIHGSPEPPLPYRLERVFPKVSFQKATHMAAAPGTRRMFVTTEPGKVFSFNPDDAAPAADLFLNIPKDVKSCQPSKTVKGMEALYSLVFHPQFAKNRFVYVCYAVNGTQPAGKHGLRNRERIARFVVDNAEPPKVDPASEQIILEWPTENGGHNGGAMCFGPDGYLYISMGDSGPASPPDKHMTGQDLSDLLSSILRIDVDRPDGDKLYSVPADNPFVKLAGARPEIWAYGNRNPWKMSFDRATGDLWVGDVGWEMWELVYRVRKGGNYGWSIIEGPQSVHPNAQRGPTPILPHDIYFSHADAASITGGYVYHGKRLPELNGTYLCGDWMTCKVWSSCFDKDKVLSTREIAQGRMRIIAFGEDNDGELYVLGYGDDADGIYRLEPNKAADAAAPFPRKLSDTGLLTSAAELTPAPGVLPYHINAEQWNDHASAERMVALPDVATVKFYPSAIPVPGTAFFRSRVFFPKEAVLAKTIFMEMERGKPASRRRLETQVLHFNGDDWNAYTYRWNDAQTDAELVPAAGAEVHLDIIDAEAPGGRRQQTWHFASRAQCLICHNGWAGPPLGFTPEQLNRGGQLELFQKLSVVAPAAAGGGKKGGKADGKIRTLATLADPYDPKQDLAIRARSYLDVNCAHCHQNGAGGTATIDLRSEINLNNAKIVEVVPLQGNFQIPDGRLLAAGDPFRSVLYYRIGKTGPGRMPHIGSDMVDVAGLNVLHDWIASLGKKKGLGYSNEQTALASLKTFKGTNIAQEPALKQLLSTPSGAMMLARAVDQKQIPVALHGTIACAAADSDGPIRDLFERFLPADKRVKRLGTSIRPEAILSLKGNADQGRVVFFKTAGVQCATCHQIGGTGGNAGPDLSQIGKKLDRAKILESILEPSKDIDPAFVTQAVQLKDGRLVIGLIVSRNDKELVLRDAQAKEHRFAAADVESVSPQRQSLMPEQLLRDLTLQQAVDLVDFLASLKGQ